MAINLLKQRYQLLENIGIGEWGVVHKAIDTTNQHVLAMKIITLAKLGNAGIPSLIQQEINVMHTMNHPSIIKLVDSFVQFNNVCLAYEFCDSGDLNQIILQRGPMPEDVALKVLLDLSKALVYMKDKTVIHRDLKPENIFFHQGKPKIGDFGFACFGQFITDSMRVGTLAFQSPEIIQDLRYSYKSDMYATGIIFFMMLFGDLPFTPSDVPNIMRVKMELNIPKIANRQISQEIMQLLCSMCDPIEATRIEPEFLFSKCYELITRPQGLYPLFNVAPTPEQSSRKNLIDRFTQVAPHIRSPSPVRHQAPTSPMSIERVNKENIEKSLKAQSNKNNSMSVEPSPLSNNLSKRVDQSPAIETENLKNRVRFSGGSILRRPGHTLRSRSLYPDDSRRSVRVEESKDQPHRSSQSPTIEPRGSNLFRANPKKITITSDPPNSQKLSLKKSVNMEKQKIDNNVRFSVESERFKAASHRISVLSGEGRFLIEDNIRKRRVTHNPQKKPNLVSNFLRKSTNSMAKSTFI